jgi:hypothetical protein
MIITHSDSLKMVCAWRLLHKSNLLTQKNQSSVTTHKNPLNFAKALYNLSSEKFLTKENKSIIIKYDHAAEITALFPFLDNANLLTQKNIEAIIKRRLVLHLCNKKKYPEILWMPKPTPVVKRAHACQSKINELQQLVGQCRYTPDWHSAFYRAETQNADLPKHRAVFKPYLQ